MNQNMTITVVGIGMGNPDTLTVEARNAIKNAQIIIGPTRVISTFLPLQKPFFDAYKVDDVMKIITDNSTLNSVAVLFSGDIGFYSGAKKLLEALEGYRVNVVCGISAVQYFCAKIHTPWHDVKMLSVHGKNENVIAEVLENEKVFLLTGGENTVSRVCSLLCENGLANITVSIGERLSYDDELITIGSANEFFDTDFSTLSVMLIENKSPITARITQGLSDELFIRGKTPMTKSEVRCVSISKLSLTRRDIVYDIGAGTGSVSVEIALLCSHGEVYSIEKDAEALELLKQNKDKFSCKNIHIISGVAPEALKDLPRPDKVFIGGTSGNLDAILRTILHKNPRVKIVINAVTLETLTAAIDCLKKYNFTNTDISQICVSKVKPIGNYSMLTAQNPVFIISAEGE